MYRFVKNKYDQSTIGRNFRSIFVMLGVGFTKRDFLLPTISKKKKKVVPSHKIVTICVHKEQKR